MKYSTIILFISLFCHSVISVCFPEESVLDCLTRKKAKETEKHQEKEDIEEDEVVTRGDGNLGKGRFQDKLAHKSVHVLLVTDNLLI